MSRKRRRHDKNRNEIRIVKKNRGKNSRNLNRKALLRRKKIYRRRRILVACLFLILIVLPINLLIRKFNTYRPLGYPSFRDEVLEGLTENIFVANTEGRSLSTDEKLKDFDKLYETIVRNYPVSKENEDNFNTYVKNKQAYQKRIKSTKTDEEFFSILDENLALLDDNYTFILGKNSYTSLFNYYRNKKNSTKANIFGNDQAVNRYGRMINKEKIKENISINSSNDRKLIIRLSDFDINKLDSDLDSIAEALEKSEIDTLIFDLSNNNSIDHAYVNEFASYFLDKNYEMKDLYFYRGWVFDNTLDEIKNSEDNIYKTSKAKNLAKKYKDPIDKINLENYQYYDQVEQKIDKKDDFRKRDIYVLTNENTANEAIRLSSILKSQGAVTIKNGLDSSKSKIDKIKDIPSDFIILDHSGLIVSVSSSIGLAEDRFLEYDYRINTDNPDKAVLDLIK